MEGRPPTDNLHSVVKRSGNVQKPARRKRPIFPRLEKTDNTPGKSPINQRHAGKVDKDEQNDNSRSLKRGRRRSHARRGKRERINTKYANFRKENTLKRFG